MTATDAKLVSLAKSAIPSMRGFVRAKGIKTGRVTSSITGSSSTAHGAIKGLGEQYAPLGYQLPWETLDYVELLSTYNPDYSQAVENIKMLANTGHTLMVDATSDLQRKKTKALLEEKARVIKPNSGGIDGIIDKLLDQAATYGACAGEWVLSDDLKDVVDFADINPKTIRFFWEEVEQRWAPYQRVKTQQAQEAKKNGQVVRGGCVKLNEVTFIYHDFDAEPESPYGTPPFLAALQNIAIQRDIIFNMSQIVKKIGLLGMIDVAVERLQPLAGETDAAFETRMAEYLDGYIEVAEDMARDGGMVHFDDAKITTAQLGGNAAGATNIHKANEEMVFSGLKSMPSVQGRSFCVVPETRVLTADLQWIEAGKLFIDDELIGFDEDLGKGRGSGACARMKRSTVERNERIELPCVKITTDKGEITVSEQHPLVVIANRTVGRAWRDAADLFAGDQLVWFGEPWETDRSYDAGYVAGMFDGEGTIGRSGSGKNGTVTMAQNIGTVLDETQMALKRLGFDTTIGAPTIGGCCNLRILGGKSQTLRFLGSLRPHRLLAKAHLTWEGATIRNGGSSNQSGRKDVYATVLSVEYVGVKEVIALQTSSRTFISEGLLSHNSTTETYAGVAYEIVIRNTRKYQMAVKRFIERGYWLIASLNGLNPDSIRLQFNDNKSLNRLQDANSEGKEISNGFQLWLLGIVDQMGLAQRLGYSSPKVPMVDPPVDLISILSSRGLDDSDKGDFERTSKTNVKMEEDDGESEDIDA